MATAKIGPTAAIEEIPCGARGVHRCVRALTGSPRRSRSAWRRTRFAATCSCSAAGAASERHSAYGFRFATIAYRWHPLFGRTFRVSPFRRGKQLTCIYTDERPDLCRELPNWMFDQGYCAGMTLGPPEISLEGLNELAGVLALFDRDRNWGAQSRPSQPKEKGGAEQTVSGSSAARARAAASRSASVGDSEHKGAGRGFGRSPVGGAGNGRHDSRDRGRRR